MKFKVLKTDILKGVRGEPDSCPIARCVKRQLKGRVKNVNVCIDKIEIFGIRESMAIPTPTEAAVFIMRFDECRNKKNVDPIEFDLEIE